MPRTVKTQNGELASASDFLTPRAALAILSAGAAVIHIMLAYDHVGADWANLVFFSVVGVAQLLWAGAVLVRAPRWLLIAGTVGNLMVLGLWAWTRTVGVPVGAHAGQVLSVGVADAVAQLFQIALVVGILPLLQDTKRWLRPPGPARSPAAGAVVVLLAVVPLTAAGLASGPGADHEHDHAGHSEEGHDDDGHAHGGDHGDHGDHDPGHEHDAPPGEHHSHEQHPSAPGGDHAGHEDHSAAHDGVHGSHGATHAAGHKDHGDSNSGHADHGGSHGGHVDHGGDHGGGEGHGGSHGGGHGHGDDGGEEGGGGGHDHGGGDDGGDDGSGGDEGGGGGHDHGGGDDGGDDGSGDDGDDGGSGGVHIRDGADDDSSGGGGHDHSGHASA